jgi:Flp pilus assembly pilin Flp
VRVGARLLRPLLRRLAACNRGATLVEFAMIAPVLLMLIMGVFDMGHNIYTKTLLEGAVQKAARDSSIEGSSVKASQIDAAVTAAVRHVSPNAELSFSRQAYTNFSEVSQPEDFTDIDKDGKCAGGEPFEDVNGNGDWDADRGIDGFGGARDAVLYTVRIEYPRLFPIANLIGLPPTFTTESVTVLRNQPFGAQEVEVTIKNCP